MQQAIAGAVRFATGTEVIEVYAPLAMIELGSTFWISSLACSNKLIKLSF
jgi:hypothetical protein